jgi:hypothetical protein
MCALQLQLHLHMIVVVHSCHDDVRHGQDSQEWGWHCHVMCSSSGLIGFWVWVAFCDCEWGLLSSSTWVASSSNFVYNMATGTSWHLSCRMSSTHAFSKIFSGKIQLVTLVVFGVEVSYSSWWSSLHLLALSNVMLGGPAGTSFSFGIGGWVIWDNFYYTHQSLFRKDSPIIRSLSDHLPIGPDLRQPATNSSLTPASPLDKYGTLPSWDSFPSLFAGPLTQPLFSTANANEEANHTAVELISLTLGMQRMCLIDPQNDWEAPLKVSINQLKCNSTSV